MPSGKARIAESSTVTALLTRRWSHRRPLPAGIISLLTVGCWAVWIYLVLPLVSLLLWAFGARLIVAEIQTGGYEGLRTSLVAYSFVLLVLVGLLVLWILWNVVRYGGSNDRRTVKRAEPTDLEVLQAFNLDGSLLAVLRAGRFLRIDLDQDDCVMVMTPEPSGEAHPAALDPGLLPSPQRTSTRSG